MASVWTQRDGEAFPTKLVGNMSDALATKVAERCLQEARDNGWTVERDGFEALIRHPGTGALLGGVFVEFLSPPSRYSGPDAYSSTRRSGHMRPR